MLLTPGFTFHLRKINSALKTQMKALPSGAVSSCSGRQSFSVTCTVSFCSFASLLPSHPPLLPHLTLRLGRSHLFIMLGLNQIALALEQGARKYEHGGISILEVHRLLFECLFIRPGGCEGLRCLCLLLPGASQPTVAL